VSLVRTVGDPNVATTDPQETNRNVVRRIAAAEPPAAGDA